MFYIVKEIPNTDQVNIFSNPSTGEPYEFGSPLEAEEFAAEMAGENYQVVELDSTQFH